MESAIQLLFNPHSLPLQQEALLLQLLPVRLHEADDIGLHRKAF
jgi:hypothetical protein